MFQRAISSLLADVAHAFVFCDCVKDQPEHDVTLAKVFSILSANGVTLNKDKCFFARESLGFLGHSLSSSGIAPLPSKVKAIQELPEPQTKSQLWSFLGLGTFVGQKSVPQFALLAAPLWKLCARDVQFEWTMEYREAF